MGEVCEVGICVYWIFFDKCLIVGVCFSAGVLFFIFVCRVCEFLVGQQLWSLFSDSTVCDDGDLCIIGDICLVGNCVVIGLMFCDDDN